MNYTNKIEIKIGLIILMFLAVSCNKNDEGINTYEPQILEADNDIFVSVEHMGVCYGPYHNDGQAPGTFIPTSQIEADLTLIAKNFDFLRTYTVADNMDQVVNIAASKDLDVLLGVHCYPGNAVTTKSDIDKAILAAKQHPTTVMCIAIGNETNLKNGNDNYVPPSVVAGYMDYAHSKMVEAGIKIPISACITGTGADAQQPNAAIEDYAGAILQKCKDLNDPDDRFIVLNIYPYYAPNSNPGNITENMQWSYQHGMSNAENNFDLAVLIGEIGWPSANGGTSTSKENIANMKLNFSTTLDWIDGKNIYNQAYNTFWFEMFDEPWKTSSPIEAYWGLYVKNNAQTPKFTIPNLQ